MKAARILWTFKELSAKCTYSKMGSSIIKIKNKQARVSQHVEHYGS